MDVLREMVTASVRARPCPGSCPPSSNSSPAVRKDDFRIERCMRGITLEQGMAWERRMDLQKWITLEIAMTLERATTSKKGVAYRERWLC